MRIVLNSAMAQQIAPRGITKSAWNSAALRHSSSIFRHIYQQTMQQFLCNVKDLGHVLRCFLFLETWRDPIDWCPNGQTWSAVHCFAKIELDAYCNNVQHIDSDVK